MSSDAFKEFVVVGTSYRRLGFGALGSLALAPDHPDVWRLKQALGASEVIHVSTCNRIETYALTRSETSDEQLVSRVLKSLSVQHRAVAADAFVVRRGRDAIEHLFQVTSSLDSLMIGETEIAGQIRRAATRAQATGLCGPELAALVERAVACSRRVRQQTPIGDMSLSVASIALRKVREHIDRSSAQVAVLVGVGEMSRKAACALRSKADLFVANRTLHKAEAFCAEHGGTPLSLDVLRATPLPWIDVLFTATSSPVPVVGPEVLAPSLRARQRSGRQAPLVICDLGVPRDVSPCLDDHPGTLIVDLPQIELGLAARRESLQQGLTDAQAVIDDELSRWLREQRFSALARTSTEAMLSRQLNHLDDKDRACLLRFVTGLASRMARQPLRLDDPMTR